MITIHLFYRYRFTTETWAPNQSVAADQAYDRIVADMDTGRDGAPELIIMYINGRLHAHYSNPAGEPGHILDIERSHT